MDKSLLSIKHLSFGYGENDIISDLNLELPSKGVVGIMGPSGVGKSSLLRTIAGITRDMPTSWLKGEILFQGEAIQSKSPAEIQPAISYFSQKSRLYVGTVLENLIPGSSKLDLPIAKERAKKMLEPLDLWDEFADVLEKEVMYLSMGEHKKVLFARMFADDPQCLLVDEPHVGVSLTEEAEINDILRKISQSCLVLVIMHNKILAAEICDQIVYYLVGN